MPSCRVYYPQIVLKPEKLQSYISENLNNKVVYTSMLYNQANTIGAGNNFAGVIQNGIINGRGIFIVPFHSSSVNGTPNIAKLTGVTPFAQYQSPFDTAP